MTEPKPDSIRYPIAMVILAMFVVGIVVPILLNQQHWYREWRYTLPFDFRVLLHPAMRMVIAVVGWFIVRSIVRKGEAISMGLKMPPIHALKAFVIGFACSLPMLAIGLFSEPNEIRYTLIYSTLLPGLTEEIFYRAFAFGLLIQAARMNLWTAAITTAIVFALAHLVRSDVRAMPISEMVGWLAMLSAGGVFFAWIYARATWNLWVVIALHAGMNLWWDIFFDDGASPLHGLLITIARIIPVGLAVYFIIFRGVLRSSEPSTIQA